MFSNIENITANKHRQAENTDARQDIRRQNIIFDRERNPNNAKNSNELKSQSDTLSVAALKTFLEKFVQNKLGKTNTQDTSKDRRSESGYPVQSELEFTNQPPKPSNAAARAASAYENMAKAKQKRQILLKTTDIAGGPPIDLNAEDIRRIYALIEDLKMLMNTKVEYIRIERAQTFIQSIENAIKNTKIALNL